MKRSSLGPTLGLLLLFLVIFSPVFYVGWTVMRARLFYQRLDTISLGMSQPDIEKAFHRKADYVCQTGTCTVLYFSRGALGDQRPKSVPSSVAKYKDLPWIYGAGQFLLDRAGKLVAYSVNGEELHVHTTIGDFDGSAIQELDAAIFEKLTE